MVLLNPFVKYLLEYVQKFQKKKTACMKTKVAFFLQISSNFSDLGPVVRKPINLIQD